MTLDIRLVPATEDFCPERMGVAKLTTMAFNGLDLRPLWHRFMQEVTEDPAGMATGMDLSVIAQLLGDAETGLRIQKEVLAHQQLYRSPCATSAPCLKVLAFAAALDIGGNTPVEFLLEGSGIQLYTLYVVPGVPLPSYIPSHDVAIVAAPGCDETRAALAEIERLARDWPRPVLNPPSQIACLDRDKLFRTLQGVPGLVIPATARLSRSALAAIAQGEAPSAHLPGGGFPLIVRPVGSHAGKGLARADTPAELAAYLETRPETAFFLSTYVDYRSADGLFRKYRVVLVEGRPFACHMAISDQWKIWYLNADMAVSAEKRAEEARFMAAFDHGFADRHGAALAVVADRLGLDYFAIDCAETPDGALLVFEADNAMIVHNMDSPADFPYKAPQMRRIFDAFAQMLLRHGGRSDSRAA